MRAATFAYLRAIFIIGHIANVVHLVFYYPMTTVKSENAIGRSFLNRKARDTEGNFLGSSASFEDIAAQVGRGAFYTKHLLRIGEIDVVTELGTRPDLSGFDSSMPLIHGYVLRGEKPRVRGFRCSA